MSKSELLYTVDANNEPLAPLPRQFVHADRLWHRTSGVWVINSHGEVLCQQRSLRKDLHPGAWEPYFGEHLRPSESYRSGAVRGAQEELGLEISSADLMPFPDVRRSDKPDHKEFIQCFAVRQDVPADAIRFDRAEVRQVKWRKLAEVKQLLLDSDGPDWVRKPWDAESMEWLTTL